MALENKLGIASSAQLAIMKATQLIRQKIYYSKWERSSYCDKEYYI